MKKTIWFVSLLLAFVQICPVVAAETALPPLVFREAKLKGEDFIVLQATTDNVKLDEYWLGYDSSAALDVIDPEYRLASVTLQEGQAAMLVNDDAVPTCDALYTMDMPLDLAETKGTVGLWRREPSTTSLTISYERVDSFSWTTTVSSKADIVRSETTEKNLGLPVWFRDIAGGLLAWRVGDLQQDNQGLCVLKTISGTVLGTYTDTTPTTPTIEEETPATDDATPAVDLQYPVVTELLPNPSGTGNDDNNEFIELYNPNDIPFSLDGFVLQTGTTTKHSYTFPAGTSLAPGYGVFYAEDTNLAMSNTSGQARLLDGGGQVIAETSAYDGADDGVAWAMVDGLWQWTTSPTPGTANTLTVAVKTVTKTAVKSATTSVKKAATTKATTAKKTTTKTTKAKAVTTSSSKSIASEATKPLRGIHPLVLVGILLAAVGYGVYEHRQDLANALYQFRSNRTARRSNRR